MSFKRRIYIYGASLISFAALVFGLSFTARQVVGGGSFAAVLDASRLGWLLVTAAALALWLGHWIPANRAARPLTMPAAAERASQPRKAYLYLGQLTALAAAITQIGLALHAALLWLLGGAAVLSAAAAWAAGATPAFLAWGYLRWECARDDDLGHERGWAVHLRRLYLYLFAFLGLVLAFGGGSELFRTLVSLLARPLDADTIWREPLAAAVSAFSVGLPLTWLAWRQSYRAGRANPAAEMNALGRVVLRYAALLLAAAVTLLGLGYLIEQIALLILRQAGDALPRLPFLGDLDWTYALAYLPAGVITWAVFADGIRADVAVGGERAGTAAVRRLVRYGLAAAALAAFWFSLTEFVRLILQVALGSGVGSPTFQAGWWARFARATALVLVAAPAWWGHWWSQQVRARAAGPAGRAERASWIRRIYLWLVIVVGAVIAVAALGFGAFLALNWPAASALGGVRAAVAGAGAAALVAGFWCLAHGLTLRGDARWLAAEVVPVPAPAAAAPAVAPMPAPGLAPAGPRRYRRADLAALAAGGGATAPARPLVVVDGGDGALGAALLAALRQARPDLLMWPIGLNAGAQMAMLNALGGGMAPAVPPDALARAAVIVGPADILAPDGLEDEVTAELAAAVAGSPARVLLLPPRDSRLRWVAAPDWPAARWVENAVIEVNALFS